jgi:hypothetical protein
MTVDYGVKELRIEKFNHVDELRENERLLRSTVQNRMRAIQLEISIALAPLALPRSLSCSLLCWLTLAAAADALER